MTQCNPPCKEILLLIEQQRFLARDVAEIHACLFGSPNTPGMRLQLDRLEQTEQRRQRHISYLWGAVCAMTASLVGLFFSR